MTTPATLHRWPALLFALSLAAPVAHGQEPPARRPASGDKPPIVVGAISSLSGPVAFPESTDAVRAYFDVVNAAGGVQGRRLKLVVEDDRGDPSVARQAARRLAQETAVVAHVGSASIVECASNAAEYASQGIVSVQGTGVEPACFESSHIAPVNTGPYLSVYTGLQFATEVLKRERPCVLLLELPLVLPAYERVIADWAKRSGRPPQWVSGFKPGDDMAPLVERVRRERCDAVVFTGVEPMVLAWMRAGRGTLTGVAQIFLTPAFTDRVARELGRDGEGIYAMSEFEPWSSRSGALSDWRSVMQRGKVPLSSFSQGGYLSAQVFVRVLRSIPGEINRQSVAAAFRKLDAMEVTLAGTPYRFGDRPRHNPNRATLPMRLENGHWRIAYHTWVVAP